MKYAETMELEAPVEPPPVEPKISRLRMPTGILGFEQIKDYVLCTNPEEEPFTWLQVEGNSSLAFVVIDPFLIAPDYKPDIPQADVDFLGLKEPDDAMLLSIVTVHGPNRATANLKGPIVINCHTRVGKQVIIANASDYSVEYPLPVAKAAA